MEGKNFLITGAANGIGLAVTRVVLGAGARVVMADLDTEAGQQRQQELREQFGQRAALFLALDVREEENWRQVWDAAEAWLEDKVDVLMNNAGVFSRADWRPMADINMTGLLAGTMLAMQAAAIEERMGVSSGGRGGTILQTASLAGLLTSGWSSHTEYTYTATKHAAVALTRGLGDATCSAWSRDRVRVLAVCPWVVDTALVRAGVASMSEEERARKQNSWVHRFITPEVVARAVARLLEAGQPGEVITVGPDNTAYTVPSAGLAVFLGCKLAHSLLSALGLVAAGEVVTVRKLGAALLVLLLATFTLLHLALSHLGL